jgi:predicted esterase
MFFQNNLSSMFLAHKLTVPKTAHYYTLGTPSRLIRRLWIVCHGYGQLAKTFIRRFQQLDDGETFVLAPEGLSRFYWGGFTGEPVASWMTKEDRLDEIADYTHYLQMLYDLYVPQLAADVQINLLGFSQGCATQCRWVLRKRPLFHHLILWAGLLPDDLDFTPHSEYFAKKGLHFVYGDEDPYLTPERLNWQIQFAKEQRLDFRATPFKGKHEVDPEALGRIARRVYAWKERES